MKKTWLFGRKKGDEIFYPGWWQLKDCLCAFRKLGKIPILTNIFQRGWFNHQLATHLFGACNKTLS